MDCNDRDNSAPCGCFSALCATFFGFGRIGNMVILKQSTEWVTEEVTDEENPNGGMKSHRFTQPKFDCIVGPVSYYLNLKNSENEEMNSYIFLWTISSLSNVGRKQLIPQYWPMLCMITYPLILGVSGFTLFTAIPKINPLLAIVWAFLTIGLIVALSLTACRDPGKKVVETNFLIRIDIILYDHMEQTIHQLVLSPPTKFLLFLMQLYKVFYVVIMKLLQVKRNHLGGGTIEPLVTDPGEHGKFITNTFAFLLFNMTTM